MRAIDLMLRAETRKRTFLPSSGANTENCCTFGCQVRRVALRDQGRLLPCCGRFPLTLHFAIIKSFLSEIVNAGSKVVLRVAIGAALHRFRSWGTGRALCASARARGPVPFR